MNKLVKHKLKNINGFIYVEPFSTNNEESDRAKIYDENGEYLDYIDIEIHTKKEYERIVEHILNSCDIEFFIEYTTGQTKYDYSENLEYLLSSIYDSPDYDEEFEQAEKDLKTLAEKEILNKYMINKVGDYYFYLGDY